MDEERVYVKENGDRVVAKNEKPQALYFGNKPNEQRLQALRAKNNPSNRPQGHFTGRCQQCGSTDLWDDNSAYGCKCCGAVYFCGG